jgi:SAM-dependent methyltransferase
MENLPSDIYDAFSPEPGPAVAFVKWLKASYGLPGEKINILDVGCGPGQSLKEYACLGWDVVGLEPNPDFYAEAKALAGETEQVEAQLGGFNDIQEIARFHLIAAINGPFAYLLQPEIQLDALKRAYQALKPGGVLFLDVPNLLWFLKNEVEPPKERKTVAGREVRLREQYHYDLHEAIFTQVNEYTIREPDGTETKLCETHEHLILTFPELAHRLSLSGFTEIRTYNSFDARQVERLTGRRMMVSAQKPG